jgi:hypothetical protein
MQILLLTKHLCPHLKMNWGVADWEKTSVEAAVWKSSGIKAGKYLLLSMKWLQLLPFVVGMLSCQPVSIADQATLSRSVFQFKASGPKVHECGLTGQLETGRALSTNVAAGGCAFCH